MKCIQWKVENGNASLVIKCCCFLCVGTIIAFPLVTQVIQYSYRTQAVSEESSETLVDGNTKFRHHLSFFQSVVQSDELPPIPTVSTNITGLFHNELSERDLEMLSGTLQTFHKMMINASIPYFMFEGSLLGSYRHHNLVAWDDDVDLILHKKYRNDIIQVFKNATSRYKLDTSTSRYKFYDISGHELDSVPWKTPFLDVSFYTENSTHLWDIVFTKLLLYNKSDIFPLADRPFLGHLYPGPRDPLRILQVNYNLDQCSTGRYNHTAEERKPKNMVKTVPCSSLLDVIPFVQHVRGPAGAWCEEVLTYRGRVVGTFVRNSTNIPVC